MTHSPVIASATVPIVHCWVCNHSYRDRGSRFCSARCREHYDSGAPIYDRHRTEKIFDVPLGSWRIIAGPPGAVIGGCYYASILDRRQCWQPRHEPQARKATRRDVPVMCATCGKVVERRMRGQICCSARCRDRGRGRAGKAFLAPDTRNPTTPLKNSNNSNDLQAAKSRPSIAVSGPAEGAS
jgi:predicted nucleic acid-binding Zn ribbon protein